MSQNDDDFQIMKEAIHGQLRTREGYEDFEMREMFMDRIKGMLILSKRLNIIGKKEYCDLMNHYNDLSEKDPFQD